MGHSPRSPTAATSLPGKTGLWKILQRKPVKLVAIALAARMARTVWALIKTGEISEAKLARHEFRPQPGSPARVRHSVR